MSRKGYFVLGLGIGIIITALAGIIFYNLVMPVSSPLGKGSSTKEVATTNEVQLYDIIKNNIPSNKS